MKLVTDEGRRLNATMDLNHLGIIVHSRSGTDRNSDYRPALELLLTRLNTAGISYEIYLCGRSVRKPLAPGANFHLGGTNQSLLGSTNLFRQSMWVQVVTVLGESC